MQRLFRRSNSGSHRPRRGAIPLICAVHKGPRGSANPVAEKRSSGIILDEGTATILFDVLGKWLG